MLSAQMLLKTKCLKISWNSNIEGVCKTNEEEEVVSPSLRLICARLFLQMLSCLEHMYHDLGLVKDFNINPITLKRWLVRASLLSIISSAA